MEKICQVNINYDTCALYLATQLAYSTPPSRGPIDCRQLYRNGG